MRLKTLSNMKTNFLNKNHIQLKEAELNSYSTMEKTNRNPLNKGVVPQLNQ